MNRQDFFTYASSRGVYEATLVAQISGIAQAIIDLWTLAFKSGAKSAY